MSRFISIWFRDLLRPKVTTVKVIIFENGIQKPITSYSDFQIQSLRNSVNALFPTDKTSRIWFDAEVYEKHSLFKKNRSTELYLICYMDNPISPDKPKPTDIPVRYRKGMFDKYHRIYPEQVGYKKWAERMEVKFVIPKN